MSLPLRQRVRIGLAFGVAGVTALGIAGALAALAVADRPVDYAIGVLRDAPWEALYAVVLIGAVSAGVALRLADSFGQPTVGRRGVVGPDAVTGLGVTLVAYAVSAFALPLGVALASPDASVNVVVVGTLFSGAAGLVLGAVTVLPVALVCGGLAGWWVGRELVGTRTEAAGLDGDTPH